MPLAHDPFDNAARVAALGAGRVLPAARLTTACLERSLGLLLTCASAPACCRALAAYFSDRESFTSLCEALAALAASPP